MNIQDKDKWLELLDGLLPVLAQTDWEECKYEVLEDVIAIELKSKYFDKEYVNIGIKKQDFLDSQDPIRFVLAFMSQKVLDLVREHYGTTIDTIEYNPNHDDEEECFTTSTQD